MTDILSSPVLLAVSLGAVTLAVASWVASVLGLFRPAARRALRIFAGAAIVVALVIIAARFVVLGG